MNIKDIYVVGGMCSGKTTLANVILGQSIMPIDNLVQSEITIHYNNDIKGVQAECIEESQDPLISFCTEYENISKEELQSVYDNPKNNRIGLFSNYSFLKDLSEKPTIHIIPTYDETNKSKWIDVTNSINIKESLILFLFRDAILDIGTAAMLSDLESNCKSQHEVLAKHCLFILNRMDGAENEHEIHNIIDTFHKNLKEKGVENAKVYPLSLASYVKYFEKYNHGILKKTNIAIHTRHNHGGTPLEPNTNIYEVMSSILLWKPFMLYSRNNLDNHVTHLINNKDYLAFKKDPSAVSSVFLGNYYEVINLHSGLCALEYTIQAIIKNIYIL